LNYHSILRLEEQNPFFMSILSQIIYGFHCFLQFFQAYVPLADVPTYASDIKMSCAGHNIYIYIINTAIC
jgi:hypothetical protein